MFPIDNLSLIRRHIDYGDVSYDQLNNYGLSGKKIESVQYNAALAITSTIRGTSSKKLSQE